MCDEKSWKIFFFVLLKSFFLSVGQQQKNRARDFARIFMISGTNNLRIVGMFAEDNLVKFVEHSCFFVCRDIFSTIQFRIFRELLRLWWRDSLMTDGHDDTEKWRIIVDLFSCFLSFSGAEQKCVNGFVTSQNITPDDNIYVASDRNERMTRARWKMTSVSVVKF